jgi:DNA-binding MarR family transcriptional regulator
MQNFDPSNSPAYQLWLATNAWQRCVRKALEPSGVTHCQFIILASIDLLREAGELPTQVAVHRFAQIDENMTSQVVKTLIAKGFIDRGRLSESGSELLKTARGVVRPAIDDFFGPLGDDRDHLTYLLRKLNEGTEFMIRSTKREAKVGD